VVRTISRILGIGAVAAALLAGTNAHADLLYYGGDFDPANANAQVLGNGYNVSLGTDGAVYDNFTVSGASWNVTSLFSNDFIATAVTGITTAHWEIRTGMSAGNGGTLLFGGDTTPTITPTGRKLPIYKYPEYTVAVPVSFTLAAGTYWLEVAPYYRDPDNLVSSFEGNTFGLNSVGNHATPDDDFWNSYNESADFWDGKAVCDAFSLPSSCFDSFSDGVIGTLAGASAAVPEPSSLALLGAALACVGASRRRKKARH
jgi:hypothetical protein